jgi:hypothetical protein
MYNPRADNNAGVMIRPAERCFGFRPNAVTVFAFLSLAAAIGCSDALSPAARGLRVPPVVQDVQPLASVSKSLPVTPLSKVILASYPFFEGVLVEGRIQGTVTIFSDAQASCVQANNVAVDYLGVWIYCNGGQCAWSAGIKAAQGTTPSLLACSGRPNNPRYTSNLEWRDTILVGGIGGNDTVRAVRGGGSLDGTYCGANLCHQPPTGANTVTLTPLAAMINLTTPNNSQILPKTILIPTNGSSVLFQVSSIPISFRGITVPAKALSWQWTPASSYRAQSTVPCPPPAVDRNGITCGAWIVERGSMVVTARVNGVVQIDSVKAIGPQITITPDAPRMLFSILQWKGTQTNVIRQRDVTQNVLVSVVDSGDRPIPNQNVTLLLAAHDTIGGHLHTGGEPTGKLDSTRINTGATGIRAVHYTAPRISGLITISGYTSSGIHGSADIQVGLFTLDSLPDGNYTKTNNLAVDHVATHYATANHIQKVIQFGNWFLNWYSHPAQFNDSSLPLGGLYDYNSTWEQPHAAHGEGLATDFFTGNLEPIAIWLAADHWEHLVGKAPGDETVSGHHLHLMTNQ